MRCLARKKTGGRCARRNYSPHKFQARVIQNTVCGYTLRTIVVIVCTEGYLMR